LGEEQGAKAGVEGEVAELCDVVIGEVYSVVVLCLRQVYVLESHGVDWWGLTLAAPMFSMAEILWPRSYTH
jgi:hypothetical protein